MNKKEINNIIIKFLTYDNNLFNDKNVKIFKYNNAKGI